MPLWKVPSKFCYVDCIIIALALSINSTFLRHFKYAKSRQEVKVHFDYDFFSSSIIDEKTACHPKVTVFMCLYQAA